MYIVHPCEVIFLANPRTGSTTVRKFLEDKDIWKPGEVEASFDGVSPGSKSDDGHMWGKHHGINPEVLEDYRGRGYKAICVVRNPWEHIVSWYTIRTRDIPFEDFVKNLDQEVFYTLPKQYPHTVQVHMHWSDQQIEFSGFSQKLEKIFDRGPLGWHHSSGRKKHYREYYNDELRDIIADRCRTEIDRFDFKF